MECRGTGKVRCPGCGGVGEVACAGCRGAGVVNPDPLRRDVRFLVACRRLAAALKDWDGRGPLFERDAVLPSGGFDARRMPSLGTETADPRAEGMVATVFAEGEWLTPGQKRARMGDR
jgi:hypothetical protein